MFKRLLLKIKENQSGFSLTELMVAMSIIGVIATLSSSNFEDVLAIARDAQRSANVHQVQTALNLYYDNDSQYPVSLNNEPTIAGWQGIKQALENPENIYMPELPEDPLNTDEYVFKYWSDGQIFKIYYETEDPNDNSPVIAWGL